MRGRGRQEGGLGHRAQRNGRDTVHPWALCLCQPHRWHRKPPQVTTYRAAARKGVEPSCASKCAVLWPVFDRLEGLLYSVSVFPCV